MTVRVCRLEAVIQEQTPQAVLCSVPAVHVMAWVLRHKIASPFLDRACVCPCSDAAFNEQTRFYSILRTRGRYSYSSMLAITSSVPVRPVPKKQTRFPAPSLRIAVRSLALFRSNVPLGSLSRWVFAPPVLLRGRSHLGTHLWLRPK